MGKGGISMCYQLNKRRESEDGGRREGGGGLEWERRRGGGGGGGCTLYLLQPFPPVINLYLSVFPTYLNVIPSK